MFIPAACLIAFAIALTFAPNIRETADSAAQFFTDQTAYKSVVIDGSTVAIPPLQSSLSEGDSILRGGISAILAISIALLTVFARKVPLGVLFDRTERGIPLLREWQSGHPGDYVSWITVGTAVLGGCFVLLLR
jgi:multicomponent Na+:H+ antiporter subunit D